MSFELDAIIDAYKSCLGSCYEVLIDNLIIADRVELPDDESMTREDAQVKFRACCQYCRDAKKIAEEENK